MDAGTSQLDVETEARINAHLKALNITRVAVGPAVEPVVDRGRRAVFGRAVDPAATGSEDMDDARNHPPVIDTPRARLVLRDMRLDQRPLRIAQPEKVRHPTSFDSFAPSESCFAVTHQNADWVVT